jgi:DNA-binding NarL/FixJ family response regulator
MVAGAGRSHTAGMETTRSRRSVFIVEDSRIVRERLVALLDETQNVCVIGEASTAKDAVEGILRTRPDWVVLDLQLIGSSGIEVLREVRARVPDTRFVVLTSFGTTQYRRVCMQAGADHFFDKTQTAALRELIAAPSKH